MGAFDEQARQGTVIGTCKEQVLFGATQSELLVVLARSRCTCNDQVHIPSDSDSTHFRFNVLCSIELLVLATSRRSVYVIRWTAVGAC